MLKGMAASIVGAVASGSGVPLSIKSTSSSCTPDNSASKVVDPPVARNDNPLEPVVSLPVFIRTARSEKTGLDPRPGASRRLRQRHPGQDGGVALGPHDRPG